MLVSIIIPCYNVQDYIKECVISTLSQHYKHLEIICIDNNSTDKTWVILEELKEAHPTIILSKESKPGASAARNKGLSLSKGNWIQFLDADDLLLPNKISNQIKLIFEKNDINFIVGDCIKRSVDGVDKIERYPEQDYFIGHLNRQLGNTCSNLFNKKYLNQVKGWDETYKSSQEAKLMFDLLKVNYNLIYDDEALTIIRSRPEGQISQNNPKVLVNLYIKLRLDIINFIELNRPEFYDKNQNLLNQILFDSIRVLAIYDLPSALKIHKNYLKNYSPQPSITTTKSYLILYRLLGFNFAEKIKKFINH